MEKILSSRKQLLLGACIFFVIAAAISIAYTRQKNITDRNQFAQHASIISADLWALSDSGAEAYLQLAVQANYFSYITVLQQDNELFVKVTAPPLSSLNSILHGLFLLPLQQRSTDIYYNDQMIGHLVGEQYNRAIYTLANIFLFLLLLIVGGLFTLNLFTNRKLLEQKVRERTREYRQSERRFHDLVNLLPEMVCETDLQGNIIYANEIALKTFSAEGRAVTGNSFFNCIVPRQMEQIRKMFADVLDGREQKLEEFTCRNGAGGVFPVLIRSAASRSGDRIIGVRSVLIDITERSSLEKQLRRAHKMEGIGLMAGGVAHDLNNILSGIINYPELILMKLPPDSEVRKDVKAMKQSGLRAAEVVADLLMVSRGVAAVKFACCANGLIREYLDSPECLKLQSLYSAVSLQLQLDPGVSPIHCSAVHVKKCIMNLVTNAAEAISGKGQIIISTSRVEGKDVVGLDNAAAGEFTLIRIADNGPGIALEDQEHIFEPFYTRKVMGRSGTGLGLTIVANTMQDHDGVVQIDSGENGTVFSLFFPCCEEMAEQEELSDAPVVLKGNGESILVVDDSPQQQDIAIQLLTALNYTVNAVSSGEEAIEYLRTRHVHLCLLDMLMPPGMNGLQTYQRIRTIHPEQKAVIASGYSESKDVKKALSIGALGFIKKPYTMDELGKIVYRALHDAN